MKIKTERILSAEDVRNMCIRNGYYTGGTCQEYNKMLGMAKADDPADQLILEIAVDIYNHSPKAHEEDPETDIAYVAWELFQLIETVVYVTSD